MNGLLIQGTNSNGSIGNGGPPPPPPPPPLPSQLFPIQNEQQSVAPTGPPPPPPPIGGLGFLEQQQSQQQQQLIKKSVVPQRQDDVAVGVGNTNTIVKAQIQQMDFLTEMRQMIGKKFQKQETAEQPAEAKSEEMGMYWEKSVVGYFFFFFFFSFLKTGISHRI